MKISLKFLRKTLIFENISHTFAFAFGFVAQLAEQLTLNQWVEGSIPSGVTKKIFIKNIGYF